MKVNFNTIKKAIENSSDIEDYIIKWGVQKWKYTTVWKI